MKTKQKMINKTLIILGALLIGIGTLIPADFVLAESCPAITTVSGNTVTFVGELTDMGGDAVTYTWFEYGQTLSYGQKTSEKALSQEGIYCITVSDLNSCTTYHYRAVARNSAGTSYGEDKSFTTTCDSPGLSIEKLVRNRTDNTSFAESISADPSDEIEFQIEITSIGDATAYNIIVKDVLPSNISYQGYLKIDGVSSGGNILSDLNLGTLTSGLSKTIIFRAKVASEANFSYGTTSLVNTASVRADEITKIYDSAVVNATRSVPSETEISIDKKVRNLTAGQTQWYVTINAVPSDKIAFKIVVTATGDTTAFDVVVKDVLPNDIAWFGNLEIEGNKSYLDITKGIDIGDLTAGTSRTITFEALLAVGDEFAYGTTDLINTAMAYNVDTSVTDTAKVKVTRTAVAGAVTEVPTGIISSFLISFGVTLVLSYCFLLGFFLYQKTFVNSGITFNDTIAKAKSGVQDWYYGLTIFDSPEKSEKRLQKIISEIRAKES